MFLIIVLLVISIADSTLESNKNSCVLDSRSCLPQEQVTRINQLAPYLFIDDDNLPYFCTLLHPQTVPSGIQCLDCSDKLVRCPPDQDMTEKWDEVCAFFCSQATITTTSIQKRIPTTKRAIKDIGSILLHTVEPPEVLNIFQTRTGSNLTSENMTASLNRTSRTLSVSSDEQNTFPVVVWIQLAFTIVLSLVGMGVALYLGCCFRGCSARYSRNEHSHSAGKNKQVRITKDRNSGVAYSANKIDL